MRTIALLLAMTACLAMTVPAFAGGGCGTSSCCADCGCKAPCRKACCQIICEYEEVEVKCWNVQCEDYCLPIPVLGSCLAKKSCDPCCNSGCGVGCAASCGGSCGKATGHCCGGKCNPAVTCGKPRVKKKLMLRTITVKKPVYKCVTKYLCGGCESDADTAGPQESAPAPKAAALPLAPKQAFAPTFPRF